MVKPKDSESEDKSPKGESNIDLAVQTKMLEAKKKSLEQMLEREFAD